MAQRTDLALEAKELFEKSTNETSELPGVRAKSVKKGGIVSTRVDILDKEGEESLGKPVGAYVTLELVALLEHKKRAFQRAAEAVGTALREMLGPCGRVLVVGLGNEAVTPDALGPMALTYLIVTGHLKERREQLLPGFADVSAITPGVLGTTGMESVDVVKSVAEFVNPSAVIVVDALTSCNPARVCSTVQIADTGIVPGSGVGNNRAALSKKELHVPVVAVGVPTVVDAASFAESLGREQNGGRDVPTVGGFVLTPRDVDSRVRQLSKIVGYGINLAMNPQLSTDDIPCFLE